MTVRQLAVQDTIKWTVREHSHSSLQYHNQNSSKMILTTQLASIILYAVISCSFILFVPRYTCLAAQVYCSAWSDQNLKKILMRTVCFLTFRKNINAVMPPNTIHFARSTRSRSLLVTYDRCLYAYCIHTSHFTRFIWTRPLRITKTEQMYVCILHTHFTLHTPHLDETPSDHKD